VKDQGYEIVDQRFVRRLLKPIQNEENYEGEKNHKKGGGGGGGF